MLYMGKSAHMTGLSFKVTLSSNTSNVNLNKGFNAITQFIMNFHSAYLYMH